MSRSYNVFGTSGLSSNSLETSAGCCWILRRLVDRAWDWLLTIPYMLVVLFSDFFSCWYLSFRVLSCFFLFLSFFCLSVSLCSLCSSFFLHQYYWYLFVTPLDWTQNSRCLSSLEKSMACYRQQDPVQNHIIHSLLEWRRSQWFCVPIKWEEIVRYIEITQITLLWPIYIYH